ncbi:purine-cytosine permease [Byssothecium circinans]|uniref:Purine-cytosine permease n=1 Tax=Byssothecium circinans TaxID=147558 RepID=A0A6A5TMK7_9PLEO|nr:purine-cytosine permease [Byssothecium circinans]
MSQEKLPQEIDLEKSIIARPDSSTAEGAVPGDSFEYGNSTYAKLQRLAGRFHVEQRGIERVPEDERDDTALLNVGTMWLSANMVISSFAIGVLAQSLFHLGFVDAILTCLFFNLIGIISVCFFSTFGPRFGLRQMVLSRFRFGWYGVKLIAVFNVPARIGWSSVNSIVGAQLIHAVNSDVPGFAGILIISIRTLFITIFGYKIVHAYEFYSWIPTFIVFLIILGTFAHSGAFVNIPMGVGKSELGSVLSFGSVVYGFATGWTSYAADYTVYQPRHQSRGKVYLAVWLGLTIPLLFTEFLGIAIMTATTIADGKNKYMEGYEAAGSGGLLAAVLFEPLGGFGKFCLVVLALSIIANNCPNIYSVALTVQVFGKWTQQLPMDRACDGGYWLAIYEGIAFSDHFIYKRSMSAYNVVDYDQPSKLPPSIAAVFAFCYSVAGMVTGMSQTWFVGPIALAAGEAPFGGDVGFELGFVFAFVSYTVARHFELRYFGR